MRLEGYQAIKNGELTHSGHRYQDLAKEYNTPLYIFDEESFRTRIKDYVKALENPYFETEVLYASKALLTKAIARIIGEYNIGQDVVSAGEIYTGLQVGVNPAKMYFHGNNKLNSELEYAFDKHVGTIVIDNRMEAQRLTEIVSTHQTSFGHKRKQRVLLRLNPGVHASTHKYIATGDDDSKFGENTRDEHIMDVIRYLIESESLDFAGFHSHIGSQIFDQNSFLKAASVMIEFTAKVEKELKYKIEEINFGGGFGVYYTEGDTPFEVTEFLPKFVEHIHKKSQELNVKLKKITIEPGRSFVNSCGSTLYTVGDLKQTITGKNYAFIDGSMNDNIRPALYQAKYEGMIVNKADEPSDTLYTVYGKACESGDVILKDIMLPEVNTGDLLLVNGTGAYNFSMASNYNYIPRPAMIHINKDDVYLTVRRDSFEDLTRNEF